MTSSREPDDARPERMIRFSMLGEIDLRDDRGEPISELLRQPKRLALLARLACPEPGAWHRRDILLALFWPELDTAHARTSLRNALHILRKGLGEAAIRTRGDDEVAVDPGFVCTDVQQWRAAMADGRARDALSLYRGEFLHGLFSPNSEGFEQWAEGERERLRLEAAGAAAQLAERLEREGRVEEAKGAARRALELHPDDEPSVRRLMRLHALAGDRAGALAAFEDYRNRLQREYDAPPAPETLGLAEELRRATSTPGRRAPDALPDTGVVPAGAAAEAPLGTGDRAQTARARPWAFVAVVASLLAVGATGWALQRKREPPAIGRSEPVTHDEGLQIEPALSPSGRLVAYTSGTPSRMQIYVTRLEGGTPWPLSGDPSSVELLPRWSPDDDAIAYLSGNNAYVAPAVGGAPRLVAAGGVDEAAVRSVSWSPRGDSLVIARHDSLLVIPLEGPGYRVVGTGEQIHSCAWSPNGQWIACVSGNWIALIPGTLFGNQAPSRLLVFPAAGGAPVAFTDQEHAYFSPTWSPDGRWLWFLSNRDGTWGEAYASRVTGSGHPDGEFRRIGLRAETISLAKGRVAYSVYSRRSNIWAIPIPSGGSATMADAVRVTTGNQIVEVIRASRDGRWLVYDSNVRGNADIYRLSLPDGRAERITDDSRDEYAAELAPDNAEVAYHLWSGGARLLHIRNLATGAAAEAVPGAPEMGVPRWSPDGRRIAAWDHRTEPGAIVVIHRQPDGTWSRPEWRLEEAQLPIWSPDGSTIAFLRVWGAIDAIPADSGPVRRLYAPRPGTNDPIATFLAWDRPPGGLYFLGHDSTGAGGIWALPPQGGRPRLLVELRDEAGRTNGPSLASDGARFYFTLEERLSNIRWAEVESR